MKSPPLASIIINNYNYGRFLGAAIESALAQTYRPLEVIVVDDGSRDNSREVIAGFGDRIIPILKANGGQCSAVNAGFAASSGDIVCLLDSDDMLRPWTIADAVALLRDGRASKAHWQLEAIDTTGQSLNRLTPTALAGGDLRERVISEGPDCYPCPPTSGNAWTREYLATRLPIPAEIYVDAVDSYLELLAPFHGEIRKLDRVAGYYRIHGRNSSGKKPFHEVLRLYEHRCAMLAAHLDRLGIPHDQARWQGESQRRWRDLAEVGDVLAPLIPEGVSYVLVDDNQWAQGALLARRTAIPFLEKDGQYWGAPADDRTAIKELERLRAEGSCLLVFGEPAFWWLDHYAQFRGYVASRYPCLLRNERLIVFDLRQERNATAESRETPAE